MTISIEDLLRSHGVGSGSGGGGIKVVKQPTQPTTGLRDGLVWINTSTEDNETMIYLDGRFQRFGNNMGITSFEGMYEVTTETNEVPVVLEEYIPQLDLLFVVQNTTQLINKIHYTIDVENKKIIKKEGNWAVGTKIYFTSIAATPEGLSGVDLVAYEDHVSVPAGTIQIPFNIRAYNPETDYLNVYQRNIPIFKGIHWNLHTNGTAIVLTDATKVAEEFHFSVYKKMRSLNPNVLEPISQADFDMFKQDVAWHENNYVKHPAVATTSNLGNDYSVTLDPAPSAYEDGMGLVLRINADSTGPATIKIDPFPPRPIVKANGNPVTNLKKDGIYTLRYNVATENFILQGEGGEYGTVTAPQVLTGYTFGTENGLADGSMPNRGAVTSSLNAGGMYAIPEGYHDGKGVITANSLASQTPATATASQILSGQTAWVNGAKITGTIPSKAAATIIPGTKNQTIAAGQYLSGIQTILGDPDLVAANIKSGINIFGVVGDLTVTSMGGRPFATGAATKPSGIVTTPVTGLSFTPTIVIVYETGTTYGTVFVYDANVVSSDFRSFWLNFYGDASNYGSAITVSGNSFTIHSDSNDETHGYNWIAIG